MSAIVGSSALAAASTNARGLGFKTSAPMGAKVAATTPASRRATSRGSLRVVAGNDYEGGLFAPIVVVARDVIGVKRFNQIRGKAIALHSQVSARGASIPRPPFRPQSFLVWLDNKLRRAALTSSIRLVFLQVITEFCKEIGADGKVRQNLIRTAKQNGGKLGFLA